MADRARATRLGDRGEERPGEAEQPDQRGRHQHRGRPGAEDDERTARCRRSGGRTRPVVRLRCCVVRLRCRGAVGAVGSAARLPGHAAARAAETWPTVR
ncbi:hypothetical protein SDC9_100929 [bioreactor metagenome]|uniref:Uncharacterized protein n=1 Tax=bioreactor metagenome TaxID=1076179 RepID=A0A645AMK9_9ZZZZ